ncbi:MAG: D-alanyl-D-alanine carboxypeptidase family protein, partial [Pseudomonadota bacterium]
AWRMGGSKMYVQEGTKVVLEDLLRGIIIQSGNDASVAVAEHIAGTEDAFADLMNQVAKQIGMKNSHFMNATGWPHPEHYTTAQDLAILTQRLIADFPQHYSMYSEKEFTYNNITQPNRNTLLRRDPTVDGVKTGHTEEAGYCLVSSKKEDGMRLISVVMGTASEKIRENESQSLLTYGFRFFETTTVFKPGEAIRKTKIWAGEVDSVDVSVASPVRLTLPRQASKNIVKDIKIDAPLIAPIKANQKIGTLRLTLEEKVMGEFPLIATQAVAEGSLWKRGWDNTLLYFTK